jgi:hypothetical protein
MAVANPLASAEIRLLRASYRALPGPFETPGASLNSRVEKFLALIAEEIDAGLGDVPGPPPDQHFMSSTLLDVLISTRQYSAELLLEQLAQRTPLAPRILTNAYECAGWGFIMRFAQQGHIGQTRVACTIVDLNLLDLSFWTSSPHWGHSGYGIAVLLFEIQSPIDSQLVLGRAKTTNMMAEFAIAVRKAVEADSRGRLRVALPMFPEATSRLFDRLLPKIERLADAHGELGHCFGADPWVLIAKHLLQSDEHNPLLACSVALNGYWAIAQVKTTPQTTVRLCL